MRISGRRSTPAWRTDEQQSIETVSKTIFPQGMWRRAKGDRAKLYKDYLEYLPDFVSMEPDLNAQGLYFARLIGYGTNHKDGKPLELSEGAAQGRRESVGVHHQDLRQRRNADGAPGFHL